MMITDFDQLLQHAKTLGKKKVAVAVSEDRAALSAIKEAERLGMVEGILVGNKSLICKLLQEMNQPVGNSIIINEENQLCAVSKAVELLYKREADILLKGKVSTAALLHAVLNLDKGLRVPGKLISDILIFEDKRKKDKSSLVMLTDGGVNLFPDLNQKIEIIHNAVSVAHLLGNRLPRVALLSAVETVTPSIPSTLDWAVISKMNQRRQLKDCIIDGPLALDNAVLPYAVIEKNIESSVEGEADILVAPNIEVANVLGKAIAIYAGYRVAHIIVGTKAPVLIPSRVDVKEAKLLSIALGIVACALC